MPLFDYKCEDCSFKKEHFLASPKALVCPKCSSEKYIRLLPKFKVHVEGSTLRDTMENHIDPVVKEFQEKIGSEILNHDTKTLDNLVGESKVKETFYEDDD